MNQRHLPGAALRKAGATTSTLSRAETAQILGQRNAPLLIAIALASYGKQSKCPHEPIRLRRSRDMNGSTEMAGTRRNLTAKKPRRRQSATPRQSQPRAQQTRKRNPARLSRRSSYAGTVAATTCRRASSSDGIAAAASASASVTGRRSAVRRRARRSNRRTRSGHPRGQA